MRRRQQGRIVRFVALALVVVALLVAARGLERHNTWYLASDQFAFLTFAADLQRATVFHDASILELAVPHKRSGYAYDALVQTYFWRDAALYSRYPPGFPAMLALAGLAGGERAQHLLNPLLYLTILLLVGWLTWTLVRPNDRALAAGAAVAATWLLLVLPTDVHLWGITVARDLPAHLLALLAILAAQARRHVLCGLALGLACTVRPDALLYGVSLAALFWLDGIRVRPLLLAGVAFVAGAAPLFVYNTLTQGHPLAFTQGGEFRDVLGALLAPAPAWAEGIAHSSGGAFQLANVVRTLPGNVAHLERSFGWLGLATVLGAVWGLRSRRPLVAALLPYPVVALVFYSCWSHPDARYLAGAALCLLPLTAVGLVVACRWVADERHPGSWRALGAVAALLVVAQPWLPAWAPVPRVGAVERALAVALGASVVLPALPRIGGVARRLAPLAPGIALSTLALSIVLGSAGPREPFQHERIARARAVLGAMIPAGSLVIASESLGRPAENITHYVGAHAIYPGEIALWWENPAAVAMRFLIAGRRVFFLLRSDDRTTLARARGMDPARVVARARGDELYDWLVDPATAPFGAVLYEVEPGPFTLELRERIARGGTAGTDRGARAPAE